MTAPAVYNPGGLTVVIDDFCVERLELWESTGSLLITELKKCAQAKRVVQMVIVCGHHDLAKKQFLSTQNLTLASEWYVGTII